MSTSNCGILDVVRKHYYFRPNGDRFDAWDVDRLIERSTDLPVFDIPLDSLHEIDSVY